RERFHAKGLDIVTKLPERAPLFGDPDRLNQLFNNLLENSLRYTDAPGQITVTLRHNTKRLVIDIEDSAPGVPKAEISRLFEPLYRADSGRSRIRGGSGLGLAICHAIVAGHAGTIEARPSSLGGLHLRIELPETPEISVASTMTHNRTKS
ncbi:MAG: ATP-binding protein, partial [Burkholderiaceae bacterium]